jgi:hypothetical protein
MVYQQTAKLDEVFFVKLEFGFSQSCLDLEDVPRVEEDRRQCSAGPIPKGK